MADDQEMVQVEVPASLVVELLRLAAERGSDPTSDRIVIQIGAWDVELVYGQGLGSGPTELHITASREAVEAELAGGIASALLRDIPLSGAATQIARRQQDVRVLDELVQHVAVMAAGRPGRRGRDDLFYAVMSATYVLLRVFGERKPVAALASRTGLGIDTIRTQIKEARKRGMLTGQAGKTGGEITMTALNLLTNEHAVGLTHAAVRALTAQLIIGDHERLKEGN
jgi:hypothetical protein